MKIFLSVIITIAIMTATVILGPIFGAICDLFPIVGAIGKLVMFLSLFLAIGLEVYIGLLKRERKDDDDT